MNKLLYKKREAIVIIIWIAMLAALFFLVIHPFLQKIREVQDEIQVEKMKQESVSQRIEDLPKVQEQFSILEEDYDLIDVLLKQDEAVNLIEKLEQLAQVTGNKISIIVQEDDAKKAAQAKGKPGADNKLIDSLPSSDYLKLKISLKGDYNSIFKFIHSLETFKYYSDVTSIQIKQVEKKESASSNPFNIASGSGKSIENEGPLEAYLDSVFYMYK